MDQLSVHYVSSYHPQHSHVIAPDVVSSLDKWTEEDVHKFVWRFLDMRFPIVYVFNKIDQKSSSKNIERMYSKYNPVRVDVWMDVWMECGYVNMFVNVSVCNYVYTP